MMTIILDGGWLIDIIVPVVEIDSKEMNGLIRKYRP